MAEEKPKEEPKEEPKAEDDKPKQEDKPKENDKPKEEQAAKEEKKDDDKDGGDKEKKKGKWRALENTPPGFDNFAAKLGLGGDFKFAQYMPNFGLTADMYQPTYAIIFCFKSNAKMKEFNAKQAEELTKNPQKLNKDIYYLYQHDGIGNACGAIALIHALANLSLKKDIVLKDGPLTKFMDKTLKMDWTERGNELIECTDLQDISEKIASDKSVNQTSTPSKDDKVGAHFIAFIRDNDDNLYELDGRKKFPIIHKKTSGKNFLEDVDAIIKENFVKYQETEYEKASNTILPLCASTATAMGMSFYWGA